MKSEYDQYWDEAERLEKLGELPARTLEYLDGMFGGKRNDVVRPLRMFVILARDEHDTWRCREVKAYTADHALAKYQRIFNYEVMGVGMLGGSGHVFKWLTAAPMFST